MPRHDQRGHARRVVGGYEPPGGRRHVTRQPRGRIDEMGRTHQPRGAHVRHVSAAGRDPRCDRRRRQRRHGGRLHHRHQRNRREVEQEARERDSREQHRARRRQRQLRACRCGKEGRCRRQDAQDAGRRLPTRKQPRSPEEDAERRAKRENEPGVKGGDGRQREGGCRRHGERVQRWTAMIEHAAREVDDRRRDRPRHGCPGSRHDAVEEERGDHHSRGQAGRQPRDSRGGQEQRRQDRDVASGDRDDVVGPGLLQPPLVLRGQSRPVTDQYGGRDGLRLPAPAADEPRELHARPGARGGRRLLDHVARCGDFDERGALHGADERNAAPRERARLVAEPRVAIRGRPSQYRGDANETAGTPCHQAIRGDDAANAEPDASAHRARLRLRQPPDPHDVQRNRGAGLGCRPVLAQHAFDLHRLFAQRRLARREPCLERRPVRRAAVTDAERDAGHQAARHDRDATFRRAAFRRV